MQLHQTGGHLDVSAMYATYTAMVVYVASPLITSNDSIAALLMFVVAVISGYFLIRRFYKCILPVIVLLVFVFLILSKLQNNILPLIDSLMISSFILFLLGITAWVFDKTKYFPRNRWGHAFWHFFSATATFILFNLFNTLKMTI